MHSTFEAELNLPLLPLAARTGHIVPALATFPLISMGQLCDAGCTVDFTATDVTVRHNDIIILRGQRNTSTRLWHLALAPPTVDDFYASAAIGSATPADLVAFSHAALFSPALSTLDQALQKNYLSSLPGLTCALLK